MSTIYTVTKLNNEIKRLLESDPAFHGLFVAGEISNYRPHPSGHHYFTLKDEGAAINAVMFRSDAARLRFRLQNGMKVVARGRVSSYPKSGQVQLYIAELMPDGAGALHVAFEQLKEKLYREGLFDEARKRPLPVIPGSIALVTAESGAAVRDMVRILGRRWPLARVRIFPVLVQGEGAPRSLCRALAFANQLAEDDLIITGRGGGSLEDLWAFNDEAVARAIAGSATPVISAVGHEPDVTIADFVADLRAPTPSGAAELAVPDQTDIRAQLRQLEKQLETAYHRTLERRAQKVNLLGARLAAHSPTHTLAEKRAALTRQAERLERGFTGRLAERRLAADLAADRLSGLAAQKISQERERLRRAAVGLDAMSPLRVLGRGYALATRDGAAVTDAGTLRKGDRIQVRFEKGSAECLVEKTIKPRKPTKKPPPHNSQL
ncbi:exodeoxyribonuclease VII large subunit [Butyricicoccus sp. 1XD8-22]|nr:exodeoxyribonuclease VII large subunit [Butyricicoccus sp. 1XD8-22]